MLNLRILETFRTKEELVNYFKEKGKNITKEEIESLKKVMPKQKKMAVP